jgi:hypothetical protein
VEELAELGMLDGLKGEAENRNRRNNLLLPLSLRDGWWRWVVLSLENKISGTTAQE